MLKISEMSGGQWVDLDCPPRFCNEHAAANTERLVVALPAAASDVFRRLTEVISEPLFVLYVLHTPRGEGEPGRYQSKEISRVQLERFLTRFERFLSGDARHDIWVKAATSDDLLVWDRHNRITAYGDLAKSSRQLIGLGFSSGAVPKLGAHLHHYRREFDADAAEVLRAFDWYQTPLHAEDEQVA